MKGSSLRVWRRMLLLAVVLVLGISASFAVKFEEKELKVDADEVRVENPDRAVVVKDGKYGLIDLEGKVIIEPQYASITGSENNQNSNYRVGNRISAGDEKYAPYHYGVVDKNGKILVPLRDQEIVFFRSGEMCVNGKYPLRECRLLDKDGKELFRFDHYWNNGDINPATGLLQINSTDGSSVSKLVNRKGEVVYSFPFSISGGSHSEGFVKYYKVIYTDTKKLIYGYADETGKIRTELIFDDAHKFEGGHAIVQRKEKFGLIDRNFQEVIPFIYDKLSAHENGLYVAQKGKKYGLINAANEEILPFRYDRMESGTSWFGVAPNVLIVNVNGKYGLIDNTGKELTSLKWHDAYDKVDYFKNGLLPVQKAGKWGMLNVKGTEVIPTKYDFDKVRYFHHVFAEGFAPMQRDGKWGIVSGAGEEVVPFEYEKISDIRGLQTVGKKNGKWHVITLKPTSAELDRIKKVIAGEIDLEEEKKEAEKAHGEKDGGNDATGADAEKPRLDPNPKEAKAGSFKVMLDGKELAFDCYIIEGSTYYKLRDLAFALNGSKKQFSIDWDAKEKKIVMNAEKPYVPVGGEMAKDAQRKDVSVKQSIAEMIVNGKSRPFVAYAIGGNNYFKLRDIGKLFDFGVEWDDALKMIKLDTAKTYQE